MKKIALDMASKRQRSTQSTEDHTPSTAHIPCMNMASPLCKKGIRMKTGNRDAHLSPFSEIIFLYKLVRFKTVSTSMELGILSVDVHN